MNVCPLQLSQSGGGIGAVPSMLETVAAAAASAGEG